mmetsp:Transcript_5945/g.8565  ORF Transcript_5945/g.8565 Transcript_5945/m.8565 type:complete len:216 (-) Transcript_5945:157-804(-)
MVLRLVNDPSFCAAALPRVFELRDDLPPRFFGALVGMNSFASDFRYRSVSHSATRALLRCCICWNCFCRSLSSTALTWSMNLFSSAIFSSRSSALAAALRCICFSSTLFMRFCLFLSSAVRILPWKLAPSFALLLASTGSVTLSRCFLCCARAASRFSRSSACSANVSNNSCRARIWSSCVRSSSCNNVSCSSLIRKRYSRSSLMRVCSSSMCLW